MAARDETYRNQYLLDIVFALSCLLMLVSLIWMFWVDHARPFKAVQRRGYDLEVAVLNQQAQDLTERNASEVQQASDRVREELAKLHLNSPGNDEELLPESKKLIQSRLPAPASSELVVKTDKLSAKKAERDSLVSQRDQLFQQHVPQNAIDAKEQQIQKLNEELAALEKGPEGVEALKAAVEKQEREAAEGLKNLVLAVNELDRLTRERDRLARTVKQKEFGWGAAIRALPIMDAFASPYRIRQDIPEGLTIDYNFRQVQRNDRCMTCHMFNDRMGFDKASLNALPEASRPALNQFNVYANHPRLDLFVGGNSPHPVEKFGCTICHSGQGGAATFSFAYHFPDAGKTDGINEESYEAKKNRWEAQRNWHHDLHPDYVWDFPMHPSRFTESACLKCHHQVLDLIRTDGREEAPKLLKGYRLVRELGCFGCHEIAGYKSGRPIGPDMRLEPFPALEEQTPLERSALTKNPNDPPGNLRKVGPGLRRLAEKVGDEDGKNWTARWIRSPRSFRPDTRMPHFFGLTNNNVHQLSDTQPDGPSQVGEAQKGFPDAEIQALTAYLLKASRIHLDDVKKVQATDAVTWARFEANHKEFEKLAELRRLNPQLNPTQNHPQLPRDTPPAMLAELPAGKPNLDLEARMAEPPCREILSKDQLQMVLAWFTEQARYRKSAKLLDDLPYPPPEIKADHKANPQAGELLFKKHGCVACHSHEQVKVYDDKNTLLSQAEFGPNLIGLAEKLGYNQNKQRAEKWLYYWLTDPSRYHSRTYMPNPQLTPEERADLMSWLLAGSGNVNPPVPPDGLLPWSEVKVPEGDLRGLAKSYLDKALLRPEVEQAMNGGLEDVSSLRIDADERILAKQPPKGSPFENWSHTDKLTFYVGRKSVTRYGCYACHDIPGFEYAKPIGTPINDWGRKEADRLAFDNINEYVAMFHPLKGDAHNGNHSHEGEATVGQPTWYYNHFFHDQLQYHTRTGFLYQKLREPRSYDYAKLTNRPWDDRLKMPQFNFSRIKPNKDESAEAFAVRAAKEEEENVEAVMTFILGLVADPISLKFLNNPPPDRRNEVAGLKVLEKFNCIGCHILKPAGFDAVLTDDLRKDFASRLAKDDSQAELSRDPAFPEHSAWRSQITNPTGRITVRGIPLAKDDEDRTVIEAWEALRFQDPNGVMQDIPAAALRILLPEAAILHQHGTYGGTFADVLMRILAEQQRKTLIQDRQALAGSVPPPLIREGQKVQPQWLYEFLRQPTEIRPAVAVNLKMPKFNMSPDDVEALVHYFVSVDRLQNPALGLESFGQRPPQRDPAYQQAVREQFQTRISDFMKGAPGFNPAKQDYFESGWQLLVDKNLCIKCHDIGAFRAEGKPEEKGPSLSLTADRLRPEFVDHWISFPKRITPYTLMPQYDPFYAPGPDYYHYQKELRKSDVRQILEVAPVIGSQVGPRLPFVIGDDMYNQLELQYATMPADKVRAVRDALMSWGYLTNPPPTARTAGPRTQSPQGEKKP
jgi:mono/diheme cytochrome c family protein